MAKVIIVESLEHEILKKFKEESEDIFRLMRSLEENPQKGKELAHVSGIVIKEIRHNPFRFYFIADGFKIKFMRREELSNLLIKFVRMSDKKSQQKTIDEIKHILRTLGEGGLG